MTTNRFIPIPETILPNGLTVPGFQVGQYVCSKSDYGQVAITAEGTPWVRIAFADAKAACQKAGYKLITESQWLAIAWNAWQQAVNWNTGIVGRGRLHQGLRNESVDGAQPGDPDEARWLTLSNGERICDLNGNVWQWIFDDIQGDESGLVAKSFAKDSPSLTTAPFPSMEKGMGWRPSAGSNWSGDALVRGGGWDSGRLSGAFRLDLVWPGSEWDGVGFRCTNPGL